MLQPLYGLRGDWPSHLIYARLPDDGMRYEVLDGEVVVSPSPGSPHQGMQAELMYQLVRLVGRKRLGRVFGDLDCELAAHDVVRPDLLVVLPRHHHRIDATRVLGTPDLAIEILSPGNKYLDRHRKRRRYERAGTPELWLVDGERHTVTQFVHDGAYFAAPRTPTRSLRLAILPEVVIPFGALRCVLGRAATSSVPPWSAAR